MPLERWVGSFFSLFILYGKFCDITITFVFRVFVVMHDLLLDDTTNVASLPQFADRKTTKVVDGANMTGYFISDFTYAELQELRLKQRMAIRTKIFDNYFSIPTFDQVMALAQASYQSTKRTVGIYPELKHPTYFKNLGFPMEDMLLDSLQKGGYITNDLSQANMTQVVPVVIQCFEDTTLQYLKGKTTIPLIQLLNAKYSWTKENVAKLASYANGVGPEKSDLSNLPYEEGKSLMEQIHAAGLYVHPWTFRADTDLEPKFNRNFNDENLYFYCCLGIDAGFTEFPDRTRESLDLLSNYTALTHQSAACPVSCSSFDLKL